LQYNNRIGLIAKQNIDGIFYNLRTNVGNSNSKGIEALIEFNPIKAWVPNSKLGNITLFASVALIDSRYADFKIITRQGTSLVETNLKNNRVENAPQHIYRTGLTYSKKKITVTAQYSYVSEAYSDANNTKIPTANGVNGLIPSYQVIDISGTYSFSSQLFMKGGINNLMNEKYFTRRSSGYPGPGLLTSELRNFFMTVGVKL